MVRDADTIEAEIARARDGLASAVDEITTRVDPRAAIEQGKRRVHAIWHDPKVRIAVVAVGGIAAFLIVRKLFR